VAPAAIWSFAWIKRKNATIEKLFARNDEAQMIQ
jgi:hypothetical protein